MPRDILRDPHDTIHLTQDEFESLRNQLVQVESLTGFAPTLNALTQDNAALRLLWPGYLDVMSRVAEAARQGLDDTRL